MALQATSLAVVACQLARAEAATGGAVGSAQTALQLTGVAVLTQLAIVRGRAAATAQVVDVHFAAVDTWLLFQTLIAQRSPPLWIADALTFDFVQLAVKTT